MPNYQITESEYAELHKLYGIVGIQEGTEPTPEQLVDVFLQATGNLRLHLAWKALEMAAQSRDCLMKAHQERIKSLEDERVGLYGTMSAMVASAGENGLTLTQHQLTKRYEITRYENPENMTFTFTATEVD